MYFKIGLIVAAMNLIYLIINVDEVSDWTYDMQENMCKNEFARFVVTEGLLIIGICLPIFIWPVTLVSRVYELICRCRNFK